MKINTAVLLLKLLPTSRERAVETSDLALEWINQGREPSDRLKNVGEAELRKMQNWVKELSDKSANDNRLLEKIDSNPPRYYLNVSRVAELFISQKTAVNMLLAKQVLGRAFGGANQLDIGGVLDVADVVAQTTKQATRLRDRLRVVPDGIGRRPTVIEPVVLERAIQAIADHHRIQFDHAYRYGEVKHHRVNPEGLVAKDGTIYLLGVAELSDKVERFALHRVTNLEMVWTPAVDLPNFDLDRYIEDSHQLSHRFDDDAPPVKLKLGVAPETIYHFLERKLSADQNIPPDERRPNGWFVVTATVPSTMLLVPFLLSMGGWIEVLEPPEVVAVMAERVHAMAAHYASDPMK